MDNADNPYAPPQAVERFEADEGLAANAEVLASLIASELTRTRPWIRSMAILCLFLGGLILAGVFTALIASGAALFPMAVTSGIVMAVFALLLLVSGMMLLNIRRRINEFTRSRSPLRLERVLLAQNSFWKFTGITAAVFFAIYLLGAAMWVVAMLSAGV
jgi:Ni,Fe-hydrogenase I cytochrome b subunit